MDAPTSTTVRSWTPSTVDWDTYGYGIADPDPLDEQVAQASAFFYMITGLDFPDVPVALEALVRRGIYGLTLIQVLQSGEDYMETIADFDLIQSLSVGNYSETRRSPEDALKARMIVAWPWLNTLLWTLMSDDKRAWWEEYFSGKPTPAFGVTEVEWQATSADFYLGMDRSWW